MKASRSLKIGDKLELWHDPKNPRVCASELEYQYWERQHTAGRLFTLISAAGTILFAGVATRAFLRRKAN